MKHCAKSLALGELKRLASVVDNKSLRKAHSALALQLNSDILKVLGALDIIKVNSYRIVSDSLLCDDLAVCYELNFLSVSRTGGDLMTVYRKLGEHRIRYSGASCIKLLRRTDFKVVSSECSCNRKESTVLHCFFDIVNGVFFHHKYAERTVAVNQRMCVGIAEADNVFAVGQAVHKKIIPEDSVVSRCTVSFVKNLNSEAGIVFQEKIAEELNVVGIIYSLGIGVCFKPVAGVVDM